MNTHLKLFFNKNSTKFKSHLPRCIFGSIDAFWCCSQVLWFHFVLRLCSFAFSFLHHIPHPPAHLIRQPREHFGLFVKTVCPKEKHYLSNCWQCQSKSHSRVSGCQHAIHSRIFPLHARNLLAPFCGAVTSSAMSTPDRHASNAHARNTTLRRGRERTPSLRPREQSSNH